MKKLFVIVMLILIGIVIVGCSSGDNPMISEMNNNATVIEQTEVYANLSHAEKAGTLDVGESVKVMGRWDVKDRCLVESGELIGWVHCSTLEIEE